MKFNCLSSFFSGFIQYRRKDKIQKRIFRWIQKTTLDSEHRDQNIIKYVMRKTENSESAQKIFSFIFFIFILCYLQGHKNWRICLGDTYLMMFHILTNGSFFYFSLYGLLILKMKCNKSVMLLNIRYRIWSYVVSRRFVF